MRERSRGGAVYPGPSMKVPPKRKGNTHHDQRGNNFVSTLNESPSEKEGKSVVLSHTCTIEQFPSMKVPPKRKGNML